MVIAPANTGRDSRRRMAVNNIDQANRGIHVIGIFFGRILITVHIKLMAPIIEDAPAMCRAKIVMSTAGPAWAIEWDSGG